MNCRRDACRHSSAHVKATVYIKDVAGDVTGHWRCEKKRGIDDFAHIAESAERNLFLEVLNYFVRHALAHPDIDESRRNRVDGNDLTRKLTRRNLG